MGSGVYPFRRRATQQKAGVSFHISIEPKGMCYMVAHCHAEIDMQTWKISNLICNPSVEQAARTKLEKVIEFLKRSQQEVQKCMERPVTA
jgi:hypothetical protein